MWWVAWPLGVAAVAVATYLYDELTKEDKKSTYTPPSRSYGSTSKSSGSSATPRPALAKRGFFDGASVIVIGRTGAGKSSLINMVNNNQKLEVGAVGATTRWLEGVPTQLGSKTITLVDSPGIGEAFTDSDYHYGIVEWYSKNHSSVMAILLVIQADAKAHADDKRLVDDMRAISARPLLIALSQSDKIKPIRESFSTDDWEHEQRRSSVKVDNIQEKISEISRQFRSGADPQVVPVTCELGVYFNRSGLIRVLQSLSIVP